jgi:hypothetical protein
MESRQKNIPGRARVRPPWLLLFLAAAAVGAAVFVLGRSPDTAPPESPSPSAREATPPKTAPATAGASAPTPPEVLVGRWQRTDGDYALDIRRVHPDGRAEAKYSNPGPINVSRAEVKQDAGRLVLFVELRDVNYPGSTYMLAYQPGQDVLIGSYHQPALGQTYEVGFLRAK